jgi:hypothetical protein
MPVAARSTRGQIRPGRPRAADLAGPGGQGGVAAGGARIGPPQAAEPHDPGVAGQLAGRPGPPGRRRAHHRGQRLADLGSLGRGPAVPPPVPTPCTWEPPPRTRTVALRVRISAWQTRAQLCKTSFTHSRHPVPCLDEINCEETECVFRDIRRHRYSEDQRHSHSPIGLAWSLPSAQSLDFG